MADKHHPHLRLNESKVGWDWRREHPVEIILVILALTLFFTLPRAGCGISPSGESTSAAANPQAAIVDPQ